MDAERVRALSERLTAQLARDFDEEWTEADEEAWNRAGWAQFEDGRAEWPIETWMDAYDAGRVRAVIVEQVQGERPRVSWRVRR